LKGLVAYALFIVLKENVIKVSKTNIHSFITEIYIAPLQGYYSEALKHCVARTNGCHDDHFRRPFTYLSIRFISIRCCC